MSAPNVGYIYLIHFARPYRHAQHYLGWTRDLTDRLTRHRAGHGARLMAVVTEAGIPWELARIWEGDRTKERKLKNRGGHSRLCPLCQRTGTGLAWPDVTAALQQAGAS